MATDCHVHAWTGPAPVQARNPAPACDLPPAALLAAWDGAGIARGVVVQPSWMGLDNAQMLDAVRRHPSRLRGVAVLDPASPDEAVLAEPLVRAIRLNTVSSDSLPRFDEPAWAALLPHLAAQRRHLEIMLPGPELVRQEAALARAASHVPLMFDHFALPASGMEAQHSQLAAMRRLADLQGVHVKLSATYNSAGADHATWLAALAEALGESAFVFGSNFPFPRHEAGRSIATERAATEAAMRAAGLTQECLSLNAARIYSFD